MKAKEIIFTIILLTFLVIIINQNSPIKQICFKETCFQIEIAQTQQERTQGLMFRESLPEDSGMLFIFQESGVYSFWMKNTLIPLDIIWLNRDLQVVHIETALPCPPEIDFCQSYNPKIEASYVLEINSDLASSYNILISDNAILNR